MSNVITKEKAKAIAQEYCTNGMKKGKAMRDTGFAESSCKSGHTIASVYNNVLVKAAIAEITAKTRADSEITLAEVVNNARLQVDIGKTKGCAADIKGGNEQLGRIAGHFEKDNLQKSQGVVIMIAPPRGRLQADTVEQKLSEQNRH